MPDEKKSADPKSDKSELFDLVKSLGKADKRFFKVFSDAVGGKGGKSYLDLFEVMEEMDHFDENALAGKLEGKSFAQHLSTTKNRLFEQLLRSQRVLKSGRSVDSKIRSLLEDIEVLFNGGLFKACEKRLRKGLKLALAFEKEGMAIELQNWQWRLRQTSGQLGQEEALEEQMEQQKAWMQRISLQNELRYLYERIRIIARLKPRVRTPSDRSVFDEILAHPLLQSPPDSGLFLCTNYYLHVQGIFHIAIGEFEQACLWMRRLIEHWEARPEFIPEYSDLYLQANHNHLNALFLRGTEFSEYIQSVQKLRNLPNLPRSSAIGFQWVSYQHELAYSMNLSPKADTVALIDKIAAWIAENDDILSPVRQLGLLFNFAIYFFITGDWSRSNKWVNHILNQREGPERQDIRNFARVFQLFLQYELGNFDLNEYLVRSAYRYMNRNKGYHDFERAIVGMIRTSLQAANEEEQRVCIENFQKDLLEIQAKYKTKAILGLQEVLFWTSVKLDGKTMEEAFLNLLKVNQPEKD